MGVSVVFDGGGLDDGSEVDKDVVVDMNTNLRRRTCLHTTQEVCAYEGAFGALD